LQGSLGGSVNVSPARSATSSTEIRVEASFDDLLRRMREHIDSEQAYQDVNLQNEMSQRLIENGFGQTRKKATSHVVHVEGKRV
jgi:hypothetical protein